MVRSGWLVVAIGILFLIAGVIQLLATAGTTAGQVILWVCWIVGVLAVMGGVMMTARQPRLRR